MKENIFSQLEFNDTEAQNLKLRAELMLAVRDYIERQRLTQKQAAEKLGVDQPKISKLIHGKIELFTIDLLVTMLARVGIRIELARAA